MDKMNPPLITINREYGAGGRALAAMLSEKLQIPYYDRDFVQKTIAEGGFDEEDVKREGEELSRTSRIVEHLFESVVSYSSSHDSIFEVEKKVMIGLADSPCIMVGRCANRILTEAGIENISIFLHAPFEKRLKRAKELKENGDIKLEKYVEDRDEKRRIFYRQYTGHEIFDASDYTICFDTGTINISQCADMVLNLLHR